MTKKIDFEGLEKDLNNFFRDDSIKVAAFRNIPKTAEMIRNLLGIIEELKAENEGLEAALAASDSYVEPCKRLQKELEEIKKPQTALRESGLTK